MDVQSKQRLKRRDSQGLAMESADGPCVCWAIDRPHRRRRLAGRVQRHAWLSLHLPDGAAGNGIELVAAHPGGGFCTFLSDRLDPFPMDMESARDVLIFLTLAMTGLLAMNATKSYRRERESQAAQRAAEEQLEFLIERD